jgi:hypothetical protein
MAVRVCVGAAAVFGAGMAAQAVLRLRKDSRKALLYRVLSGDRGQR